MSHFYVISKAQMARAAVTTVPKSGCEEIDSEAIVIFQCLRRLDHRIFGSDVDEDTGVLKPNRMVKGPRGESLDISYRTAMGATPDEFTPLREEDVPDRSDSVVAESSLQRLMCLCSAKLHGIDSLLERDRKLTAAAEQQDREIQRLRAEVRLLNKELVNFKNPQAAFELYKQVWYDQCAADQKELIENAGGKQELLMKLVESRHSSKTQARKVAAGKALFGGTERQLHSEFDRDQALFDSVMRVFQPPPSPKHGELPGLAEGEHQLSVDTDILGDSDDEDEQPEIDEEAIRQKILNPKCNEDEDDEENSNERTQPRQQGDTGSQQHQPASAKPQREGYLITRYTNSSKRTIEIQDSGGRIIALVMSMFVHSRAHYLAVTLQLNTMLGRAEELTKQATAYSILDLWLEVNLFSKPTLYFVQCDAPPITSLQQRFTPNVMDVTLPQEAAVCPTNEIPPALLRVLELKRLPAWAWARKDEVDCATTNEKEPSFDVYTKQAPGIVSLIAHDFGKSSFWRSPIEGGHVRCYASSKMNSCRVDALLSPFQDLHGTFFSTRNEVAQYVGISFHCVYVIPTAYSIASTHPIHGGLYPRSWRIEASIDATNWVLLRRHVNDGTLSRYCPTTVFDLQPPSAGRRYFQHFRIVQDECNALGTNELCICCFELYGRLMFVRDCVPESSLSLPPLTPRPQCFAPPSPLPEAAVRKAASKKRKK